MHLPHLTEIWPGISHDLQRDGLSKCKGFFFNNNFKNIFIYLSYLFLFLAVLDLCCCAQAFSSCGERGLLFVAVHGLLIAVASLVVEHGL